MKLYLVKSLLISLLVAGCTQTPVPYKLSKTVEQDYRLSFREIPLGVTQEKISDTEYRITTKLSSLSSHKRASSMALYRSASLAEEQGYDAFIIDRISSTKGCSSSTSVYSRAVVTQSNTVRPSITPIHKTSVTESEPRVSLLITLVDYAAADKKARLKLAKVIKENHQSVVDNVPSKLELEKVAEENIAFCKQKKLERINKYKVIAG